MVEEGDGDGVEMLGGGDVPLEVGDGLLGADRDGFGGYLPTEADTAQMTLKKGPKTGVCVLGKVDGALAEVVADDGEAPADAGEVDVVEGDVGSLLFDMEEVPEGEGVVVAKGEEDGVGAAGLDVCHGDVVCGVVAAAVVVGPVAGGHGERSECQEEGGKPLFEAWTFPESLSSGRYPEGYGVEAEHVGVVALAWLVAGVVEVEVEEHSAKEEEEHHEPVLSSCATAHGEEAIDGEECGEDEECDVVVAFDGKTTGVGVVGGGVVYGFTACKVVHQIAAVHVAELIGEVVDCVGAEACSVVGPVAIVALVGVALAPHAGIEGSFFVLVAGKVLAESLRGGGVALVDGCACRCTNGDDGIGGKAEQEEKCAEEGYPPPPRTAEATGTDEDVEECRCREEDQQMHSQTEAQQEGYQQEAPVVAPLFPPQHDPYQGGCDKHGQTVDFALDGREPHCVGKQIAQCTHQGS